MAKYTKAKIFNMALKNLGVSVGVQGANQGDRNSVVLDEFYETAKEKTLADHDWGFASAFRELTPTGNDSLHPKFKYEYDYPNNCLKVREVYLYEKEHLQNNNDERISFNNMAALHYNNNNNELGKRQEFISASDDSGNMIIYTNVQPAIARFTRLVSEETYYTPEFAMALSWYLAFLAAPSITGARVKTVDCLQIYKQMLREGTTADANEGFSEEDAECDWIEARN